MNKQTTTQGNRRSPRLWALALVAGSAMCLAGCGPKFMDGYVVKKEYTPAHKYRYTTIIMVGKVPVTQLHTGHRADKWTVTIARENWSNDMETIEVTKATFDEAKLGQKIFLK